MSDESNSPQINDGMSEISDQVDQAVAGNSQDSQSTGISQETAQQAAADAKSTLKDPKASKGEKKAAQKLLQKLTLKIDGQEYEEDLPFGIPNDPKAIEWMRRELQMGRMGQKRAQEKAAIEKDVAAFINDLKNDPIKALSDPGFKDIVNLQDLASKIMEREIENSKKSPEQLENEKIRAELKAERDSREREKKELTDREQERLRDHYLAEYDNQLTKALETNQIPKSPAAIKKFADYMEIAVNAGKDVSVNDLVPLIREELAADFKEHLAALPEDALEDFIGKAVLDKIRKKGISKAKQAGSNPAVKGPGKTQSTGKASETKSAEPKKTFRQFFGA